MVTVIGAGLAGCEAAWQIAQRGVPVRLVEMKPLKRTPAHHTDGFAELVCSNSLRGDRIENAVGLLKEEMRRCGSLILQAADQTRVPAGGALAVDRHRFSALVTEKIRSCPNIEIITREITDMPEPPAVVATGPLTSEPLAESLFQFLGGSKPLFFFDAAAPLISADSLDMEYAYWGARYGRGEDDYINCPMDKPEYLAFREALSNAEQATLHEFEDDRVFEGCLPVEVMARRGEDTLRYGPMRPIGLRDPRTGKGAYAVLQLRQDNAAGSVLNMVGFQTHLLFGEQKRVFSMIPALREAEFLRYGVMHRNTFVDSPRHLHPDFSLRKEPRIWLAGQMTGVEGYVESAASGLIAGLNAARTQLGEPPLIFPPETALGALAAYVSNPAISMFQPMNVNFGLLPPLPQRIRDKQARYRATAERGLNALEPLLPSLRRVTHEDHC